jgi:hypothetical protein
MYTPEKISVKIGLIAGQGALPEMLLHRWEQQGFVPVVVALDGITAPDILNGRISRTFSIGQAGHILDFLTSQNVEKLVMIGSLKRPNFLTLRTDMVGLKIILKLLFRKVGDDGLLRTVRNEIESRGIKVVGAHEFLPEILCPVENLTALQPDENDWGRIRSGFDAAKNHGAADKGQSVVIAADGQISFEGTDGTNALISSCKGQAFPILVKVSKPQQDLAFDMPTIGLNTIETAHKAGFKGIAIEAGKALIVNQRDVVRKSNEYGLFLVGIGEKDGI